jgi:YHS domain-containing protein
MTFLARIVRFLFWLFVVSWSVWLLRRVFGWMLQNAASVPRQNGDASAASETSGTARRLVRDPVCGMHVDETLSIPLREGGGLVHFCSTACRDAYTGDTKKLAANG